MSKTKRFLQTDNSGWLFIGFLVIVGIILVFYFVFWSEDVEYNPNEVNKNVNEAVEEEYKDIDDLTEEEAEKQGKLELLSPSLDFTLVGYNEVGPDFIGDTYLYHFGEDNYLTVMPGDMEGIVRESQNIASEEDVTIDGYPATFITGASNKDGSPVYMILLEKDEWLYNFGGSEEFLEQVDEIFNFNK
ncbi:MAG: hypothetical protein ABH835_03435 [Patescibacteria group bacterium]